MVPENDSSIAGPAAAHRETSRKLRRNETDFVCRCDEHKNRHKGKKKHEVKRENTRNEFLRNTSKFKAQQLVKNFYMTDEKLDHAG